MAWDGIERRTRKPNSDRVPARAPNTNEIADFDLFLQSLDYDVTLALLGKIAPTWKGTN